MKISPKAAHRITTTAAEIRMAVASARIRERTATKIKSAHYNPKNDRIVTELSTGAILAVPRRVIPGFAKASKSALVDIEITPEGEGLWSEILDDGVLLEQLIVLTAGAATLGSIGARLNAGKKSPARAAASRANGAKGGRPRKNVASAA